MTTIPKYENLSNARYELIQYLNDIGDYHPTRSLIERAVADIDKVMKNNPTTHACTPEPGYVDQKFEKIEGY